MVMTVQRLQFCEQLTAAFVGSDCMHKNIVLQYQNVLTFLLEHDVPSSWRLEMQASTQVATHMMISNMYT